MNTTINPKAHVVIKHPPVDVPTTFVIARPPSPGQLYVTSCKIGNVSVMEGDADLFVFGGQQHHVPADLPVSLSVRSNWDQPLTVNTHQAIFSPP